MTTHRHKNVPAKIKQLAEERARIHGKLMPLKDMESEFTEKVEQISNQLRQAIRNLERCKEQRASLTTALQQCDEKLVALKPSIDPSKIEPIQGSKGR